MAGGRKDARVGNSRAASVEDQAGSAADTLTRCASPGAEDWIAGVPRQHPMQVHP